MFDLIDEAFNQVPLTIQMLVVFSLLKAILFRWNHSLDAACRDRFEQSIRVIAFVGNQHKRFIAFNQVWRLRAVMSLTCRQDQAQWITQSINGNVNLG
jgi:hypothetical protein